MRYAINLSLDKEQIKETLDMSGMVFKEEWLEIDKQFTEGVSRIEVVDTFDVEIESISLIKYYWVGFDKEDIEVGIMYSVDIDDYMLSINFKFYQTYVDGFKHPVLFDIRRSDDSIKGILNEWIEEFDGVIDYIDELG